MTPADRKRKQRERDRIAGWREILVRVPSDRVDEVREFVANLPPPNPPIDPDQLDLLRILEDELRGVIPSAKRDSD